MGLLWSEADDEVFYVEAVSNIHFSYNVVFELLYHKMQLSIYLFSLRLSFYLCMILTEVYRDLLSGLC